MRIYAIYKPKGCCNVVSSEARTLWQRPEGLSVEITPAVSKLVSFVNKTLCREWAIVKHFQTARC